VLVGQLWVLVDQGAGGGKVLGNASGELLGQTAQLGVDGAVELLARDPVRQVRTVVGALILGPLGLRLALATLEGLLAVGLLLLEAPLAAGLVTVRLLLAPWLVAVGLLTAGLVAVRLQIGRASCRERVS
jgi:hypothetical protein